VQELTSCKSLILDAVSTQKNKKANAIPWAGDLTRLNGLSPQLGNSSARSIYFALVFSVIAGWLRVQCQSERSFDSDRLALHVPRIWIRSINPCELSVKRKSQNLANFFHTRPYLVVALHKNHFSFLLFLRVACS
jgi:hypothetical protein